jgi:hypothetical protein
MGTWLSAVVAVAACNRAPQVTTRTVTVYAPKSCINAQTPLDAQAYVEFDALGDFDPPPQPAGGHLLGALGAQLTEIEDDAQMLVVEATEADREWQGVGDVAATGNVDVLVTPTLTSCALTSPAMAAGSRSGAVLAPIGGRQVLLVGGVPLPKMNLGPPRTYIANLNTGAIVQATPDLLVPRTGATVTAFGSGALVAGGIDPQAPQGQGSVQATAEVFDTSLGGFDQQSPIMLSEPRADAGAVVLPTGETLLVGGLGADGTSVLASMEIVDPATRTVRTANVAQLSVARSSPTVLLLASGEVLVVGGLDGSGNPVNTLEWFSADISQASQHPSQLVTGQAQSAVALEGGGALVVIAPPANAGATFNDVWMIDADGAVEAAQPIEGTLTQPVLFGGAAGAPLLWTGDRWLRWQPWQGSFGDADVLDNAPASISEIVASPDSGLALWLDATDLALTALRFDTEGEYSALPGALLAGDDGETAPDRLSSPGVVTFDPSTGVTLAAGASVFVTDRTYANVTIDVDQPTGEPVLVVLRDQTGAELEVGGETCPGPLMGSTAGQASTLHVQRMGTTVTWKLGGGSPANCATGVAEGARLSIGLRGPEGSAQGVAANLIIARVSDP